MKNRKMLLPVLVSIVPTSNLLLPAYAMALDTSSAMAEEEVAPMIAADRLDPVRFKADGTVVTLGSEVELAKL